MSHTGQQQRQRERRRRRRTRPRPRPSTRTSTTYDTSNKTNNNSNTQQQQQDKQHSTKTIKTSKGAKRLREWEGGERSNGTLWFALVRFGLLCSGVSCLALLPCWLRCSNAGFFFGCLRFHAFKSPYFAPLPALTSRFLFFSHSLLPAILFQFRLLPQPQLQRRLSLERCAQQFSYISSPPPSAPSLGHRAQPMRKFEAIYLLFAIAICRRRRHRQRRRSSAFGRLFGCCCCSHVPSRCVPGKCSAATNSGI